MFTAQRLLFACGAWLLCCSAGAAAVDILAGCAAQAAPGKRGIVALEAQCPGLESALRELGVVDALPDGWRDSLSAAAVGDLGNLAARYGDVSARGAPDTGALPAILDQLAQEQVKPVRSWWEAVKQWLRSWSSQQQAGSTNWLDRLLTRLAQSADLIKVITYVLLAVAVVAAIAFIVNELRVAGVLSRRRGVGPDGVATVTPARKAAQDAVDLDAAALRDQPAILLRLLVAHLLRNGQLQAERNLTHRELVTHSAFADAESRLRFARVTQLAERMLYGSGEANVVQANAVIADGRLLLQQLQAPAGLQP